MRKNITAIGLIAALMMFSCAHPVYQKAGANGVHRVGYSDSKIQENMYRVHYLDSKAQQAYINFLRRASELTIASGKRYFTIKDVGMLKESGPTMHLYNTSHDLSLPQYEATVVVQAGKVPDAFDSEEILKANPIPTPTPAQKQTSAEINSN